MKTIGQFRGIVLSEESEYSKFDVLIRAGLANKAQIQRIHKILSKMEEERPVFSNADRMIMQNLFNRMVELLSNNKQIFTQARRAVHEDVELEEAVKENEDSEKIPASGPPMILVLKRKYIRNMSNNIRIALYYNDKLKKFFSVPYTSYGSVDLAATLQAEDVVRSDDIVIPDDMMELYQSLDEENKKVFVEMLQDEDSLKQLLEFTSAK